MNIVVLAGGLSPERDVSLSSGCLIANALMEKNHRVLLMDVYMGFKDTASFGEAYNLHHKDRYEYKVPATEPNLERLRAESGNGKALIGPNVLAICGGADVVFLGLHGDMGENGQLQAVLETHGIPFTGSGSMASMLAMDKLISKKLMRGEGIPTPDWAIVEDKEIPEAIGLPCVMKPCGCGSSVGVSIVENEADWEKALAYAEAYGELVFAEKKIAGREFSVGILDGEVLPPIEIIPKAGFYDYKNKYQPGLTEEVCPAGLSGEETKTVQGLALQIFKLLRLRDYARIDFLLDEAGKFTCLEANTLPGMTPTSLLPQEAAAVGIDYPALCQRIAKLAMERDSHSISKR